MSSKIGVIDIGSNSFHLVIGGYINQLYYQITNDYKVNVRLGEGLNETGRISQDRMDFGIQTLVMYQNLCQAEGLEKVITVATEAVRRASNGDEFVRRAKEEAGIDVTIIPGTREAELDYLGCVNSLEIKDALMMDIGGASAEFVLIKDRKNVASISLPFGSITLTEQFELGDVIKTGKIKELKKYLRGRYDEIEFFEKAKGLPVIGVGGTIRNIGRIHRQMIDYPLEIAHNYVMKPGEVGYVLDEFRGSNPQDRAVIPGLSSGRRDIFVAPAYALKILMKYIDSPRLIISDFGLRDGVIFDHFGFGPGHLVHNIFHNSLINTLVRYNGDIAHAYQVLGIVTKLYDCLGKYLQVVPEDNKVILTSCMLHDIGTKIKFRNHHEHSFYLILNTGLLGLSQKDILLSAFVALHHRSNKKIRIDKPYKVLLNEKDLRMIDELSLFLQIAEHLDRSLDGAVRDITIDIDEKSVFIHVFSVNHSVFTDIIMSECEKKFHRVFGRKLYVDCTVVENGALENKLHNNREY